MLLSHENMEKVRKHSKRKEEEGWWRFSILNKCASVKSAHANITLMTRQTKSNDSNSFKKIRNLSISKSCRQYIWLICNHNSDNVPSFSVLVKPRLYINAPAFYQWQKQTKNDDSNIKNLSISKSSQQYIWYKCHI